MASAEGDSNQTAAPLMCVKGCGFFGNSNTQSMCSKCYKETIAAAGPSAPAPAMAAPAVAPSPVPASPPSLPAAAPACVPCMPSTTEPVAAASSAGAPAEDNPKPIQTNTSRCWTCNKKIGLLGFKCKCDYFYCSEHRYSDQHKCSFDYKAQGKQQLTQANPTITPEKVTGF